MKTAYKYLCSVFSLIATIHLELLAHNAIQFAYSWCGNPGMKRGTISMLYLVTALPAAIIASVMTCKRNTLIDRVTRITTLVLIAAFVILCLCEQQFLYNWVARL